MLNAEEKSLLLLIARESIVAGISNNYKKLQKLINNASLRIDLICGAFVTIKIQEQLRGCIGHLIPLEPIVKTIVNLAEAAAFSDPRFPRLNAHELEKIMIEISLLSELEAIHEKDIIIGKHGLYLKLKGKSGVFLPQVAIEQGWDRKEFLSGICRKAGLVEGSWKHPQAKLQAFTAEVFC